MILSKLTNLVQICAHSLNLTLYNFQPISPIAKFTKICLTNLPNSHELLSLSNLNPKYSLIRRRIGPKQVMATMYLFWFKSVNAFCFCFCFCLSLESSTYHSGSQPLLRGTLVFHKQVPSVPPNFLKLWNSYKNARFLDLSVP